MDDYHKVMAAYGSVFEKASKTTSSKLPPEDIENPIDELERITREVNRRRWITDPAAWVVERAGGQLWSKQRQVLYALASCRRVAVASCHEIGKSWLAAQAACWWLDTHKPGDAFVVTSAPTVAQVRTILWREIGRVHTLAKLNGRLNQTEWLLDVNGREEQVAIGRKPDEYSPDAFQGIHAPFVLMILDESCGVHGPLWDAADSLIANDNSKMLIIGNPDDPKGEFADACQPGSGWRVINVSAFDSPNFTGEPLSEDIKDKLIGRLYVEERRHKWAHNWYWVDAEEKETDWEHGVKCVPPVGSNDSDTAPLWQSKVLGRFPTVSEDQTLIPLEWIRAAQQRELQPGTPVELGQDVGGGGDESVIALRRGNWVRIVRSDRNPDTMATCGNLLALLTQYNAAQAKVDEVGIGRGVVNRAQELNKPVVGVNVGAAPRDKEHFANLRAELYWDLREAFERGLIDIDPQDDDLAAELGSIRFKRNSRGQILIESKAEAKKRGVPSPNRADALMLARSDLKVREWAAVW